MCIQLFQLVKDTMLNITSTEKTLLQLLAWHAAPNERSCFPSYHTLERETFFHRTTCHRALMGLQQKKIIQIEPRERSQGAQSSNLYTINIELLETHLFVEATHEYRGGHFFTRPNMSVEPELDIQPNDPSDTNGDDLSTGGVAQRYGGGSTALGGGWHSATPYIGNTIRNTIKKENYKKKKETKKLSKEILNKNATDILLFFRKLTGHIYDIHCDALKEPIINQLKKGISVQDCKTVIAHKWNNWKSDSHMKQFVRPSTIFKPGKFEEYLAQIL